MAFINEPITDENGLPSGITVDRERNMLLKRLSAFLPDFPADFTLSVNGDDIRFEAFQRVVNYGDQTFDIRWEVSNVYTPKHIHKEDALLLIKEVLEVHGFSPLDTKRPNHTEVKFYI